MKKTLLLLSLIVGIFSSIHSQVTSVDYQIKYNDSVCEYDAYIIINAGSATTVPQRIQFNAQYSIVVPTGTNFTVTESYMPLQSNATYTGTVPLTWSAGTPIIAPGAQPESDFYSITPDLGITSHYNNLAAGDTIKIFSFAVDTIFNCSAGIRIYENGVDPDSNAPGMGMADFNNGFTLGNINMIYAGNSPQIYPPVPEVISITNACSNGLEIDLTAETSACQSPMTYVWTGPDGYTGDTEDVNINPALPANNGVYKVVITDAFGCKDSITIDATSKPDAGPDLIVCAGSTTTINGTMPTTGTWSQASSNPFGASLSPLAGGTTEVTFSTFASGLFEMIYAIPGCADTMLFTVNPPPLVSIAATFICENGQTVASSNIPGGTWVSNSAVIATVDPNTGVVTGQSAGVVTLTYTAPTGCSGTTSSLTVNPGPIVTVDGTSTICIGGATSVIPTVGGIWSTSDPSIATVTNAGVVEGISAGTVTLSFTDTFTGCTSDGLEITVTALPVATFIGSDSICVNGTTTLSPNTGGTWTSSNPIVATIDNSGNVTGQAVGTAVFTYTNLATGCVSLPSTTLWVLEDPTVAITGDDRLCIGETTSLSPNTGGTWVSNNPGVATVVAATGIVTGVAQGTTTVTYTDNITGCSATTTGIVVDPVPSISTDSDSICITSTALLAPATGGTWVALNPGIASLVGNTVTGVASGDAGFIFTADATGCVSDTLFINVEAGATTTLTGPNQICIGGTTTIEPSTGGTWSSSDETIAGIDNFGNITGVGAGVTTFTYTSAATLCSSNPSEPVQVTPAPIVSTPSTSLCIGESMSLSPSFGGSWSSSDVTVLTVNAFTGLATAVGAGNASFIFTDAATGCSAITAIVSVNASPIIEFTAPDTICVGFTTAVSPVSGGTWVSSAPGVATVDNLGNVTGLSAGNADLIYTDANTGCTPIETLTVTVLASTPVSITGDDEICIGETSTLSPSTGGVWTSNDPTVATVNNAGVVIGIGPGQATFTFISGAGQCTSSDTDPITVNGSETIVLDDTELCIGETTIASTTALGTWTTTDPSVATIDANSGTITAVAAGTVTVIFTNTTTSCVSNESEELTVYTAPELSFIGPDTICLGEYTQVSFSPGGTWSTSNTLTATIDNFGNITPLTTGEVDIIFTPFSGGCQSESLTLVVTPCLIPEFSCEDIQPEYVICDYDAFVDVVGTLPSENSPGNQPEGELCNDHDEAGNIHWIGFVALEGDYTINVYTSNCTNDVGGIPGVQTGIFADCSFEEESLVSCSWGIVDNFSASFSSNSLIPGETYYLYVDGHQGSVCDYSIEIVGEYDSSFCEETTKVTGIAYIDENENEIFDAGETPLRNVLIASYPETMTILTNDEGRYTINVPKGGSFVTAKVNEGEWENDFLNIYNESAFASCIEDVNFGFIPLEGPPSVSVSVVNTIVRCDWETHFYITLENIGSNDVEGIIEFEFDDKTTFFNSTIANIDVSGNIASANTGILEPFKPQEYRITLKMPSGSANLPILDFKATFNDQNLNPLATYEYSEQLRCSYDPNDKREYPNRVGEDNLTLMDENLEYTIRFQNNGNDTAFQVKIVDPLDPNIDPSSIRVISSSHAVETCIENENLIFLFENINLVDSMTNYEGSQGYVSFRCNAKKDRLEYTIVHNTADIIFDTNVPIVTNTTINTLVSELCTFVTTEIDIEICEGENYNGYVESGIYSEVFPLEFGCDSTVIINLDVQGITYSSQTIEVCEGELFDINGEEYELYESQVVRDSTVNALGCLSNVTIYDVKVNPIMYIDIDTIICEGYEYNGFTESGVYTIESFDEITGCDIITTIDLEVLPKSDPSCIVGIADLDNSDFKIYPVPARDVFYLEGGAIIDAVTIYTLNYQKVEEYQFNLGMPKVQLSTDNLSQGLYIVEIESKGHIAYKKLIVE